jgi:hypothetical protein
MYLSLKEPIAYEYLFASSYHPNPVNLAPANADAIDAHRLRFALGRHPLDGRPQ